MGTQHRWLWLLVFIFIKILETSTKELRVVCYYTNWSVYRPGSVKFSPQNINPYLCTHLVYAFGGFTKENTLKPFDKYQDIEKGGYAKFTGLKTYNKNLKTMLAIGGWNEGSSRFSPMVASAERRKELVKNVVKFLRQNHFDGLDLDWEYPSFRDGGKSRDRDNYAQLVQELREEFERESQKTGRPRLLLTMAVPAGIEYINKGYDVPKLMKYLDWMNILSYDYHSAFEPSVNHHAPLYPLEEDNEYNYDTDLNIEHTIQHYLKAGAISDKLVLGIPTYGRSYTLFNPDANDIGAPADGPGEMGDATRENGYLAYYEICEAVNTGEWTVVQPNEDAMGPYAFKENQWVGYDDESIARKKAQYVADKDLGGIMFWSIDNDDFRGSCHNKSYPIIEAAKEALVDALGLGNENAIQKSNKNIKPRTSRLRSKTTEEPSTERTRNSGGRQGSEPTTSRRRQQGRGEDSSSSAASKRRRPSLRKSSKSSTTEAGEYVRESGSSLVVTTPSWKTPEPPTTPDPGGDFKCEDEGFYPHPRDCKKYFWCLSGPSELGIIAHQFTCPSGLYFNKAASSCDYTQNVLCNKKTKTTTKTTTEMSAAKSASITSTTEEATKKPALSIFSTRRPLPKITAATSRTTFVSTTSSTTPEYEEDYEEYEDEERKDGNDAESEDPQVIKELLELIKKAGGIEELEKQLNLKDDANEQTQSGPTTASPIKQILYKRVLAKTKLNDVVNRPNSLNYSPVNRNRNSRGPQNAGLSNEDQTEKSVGRPKYSTISRARTTNIEEKEEEATKEVLPEKKEPAPVYEKPKYISLRRNRVSTTASPDEDEEDDVEEEVKLPEISTTSKSPYVTLKRSRPTTTTARNEEESLDRVVPGEEEVETASPNYVVINRQRSSTSPTSTSRYKEIRRSTTPAPVTEPEEKEEDVTLSVSSTAATNSKITNTLLTLISDEPLSHTLSFETTTPSTTTTTTTIQSSTDSPKNEIIEPQLLEPRPFSISHIAKLATPTSPTTKTPTTTTTTSTTSRVETDTPKRSRRPVSRFRPEIRRTSTAQQLQTTSTSSPRVYLRTRPTRRPTLTRSTAATFTSSHAPATTERPGGAAEATRVPPRVVNRFRTSTRRRFLVTTTTLAPPSSTTLSNKIPKLLHDQSRESTMEHSKEDHVIDDSIPNQPLTKETTELADLAFALHNIQKAPLPANNAKDHSDREVRKFQVQTANSILTDDKPIDIIHAPFEQQIDRVQISSPRPFLPPSPATPLPVRATTRRPKTTTTKATTLKAQPPQIFDKLPPSGVQTYTYKPITDYDYYDEGDPRISIPEHSKVLIHSSGVIQCLDQGNFPHPVSCKKFISCAKMETGNVLGWEYTCPKNLSFDPIGGMCNWSAGLGCRE